MLQVPQHQNPTSLAERCRDVEVIAKVCNNTFGERFFVSANKFHCLSTNFFVVDLRAATVPTVSVRYNQFPSPIYIYIYINYASAFKSWVFLGQNGGNLGLGRPKWCNCRISQFSFVSASSHLLAQVPLFLQNENHAVIVNLSPCLSSSTFPHWHDLLFSSSVLPVCHLTSFLPVCHLTSFLPVCHLTSFLPVCHLTSSLTVCHLTSFLPVCHLTSFLTVCHHPSFLPVRFTEQLQKVPHVLTQVYSIFHCAVYRSTGIWTSSWNCRTILHETVTRIRMVLLETYLLNASYAMIFRFWFVKGDKSCFVLSDIRTSINVPSDDN